MRKQVLVYQSKPRSNRQQVTDRIAVAACCVGVVLIFGIGAYAQMVGAA